MNTGLWLEEQFAKLTEAQRQQVFELVEDLDERQAIIDESRDAELRAAGLISAPRHESGAIVQWQRDMYPEAPRMGKDLRSADASRTDIAIFTSHLFQPSKKLDGPIKRTATWYATPVISVDTSRRIFRKVPA